MARTQAMATVLVQFKGQSRPLALPLGGETTWRQLQQLLASEFGVAPDAQRVFFSRKRVEVDDAELATLKDLGIDANAANGELPKLSLMAGASKEVIEDMKKTKEETEAEMRIRANRKVVSIGRRNDQTEAREAVSTDYRFHAIEVLENFSDSHRAQSILEQLANDRGILAVMAKHKWSVGCLAEMYPEGKVGVDPVCVLGLNQNKGQKILLRLRTDDLQGFRKYLNIKKVLFHELSHNVHSEHDSKFYQLMRTVERECDELDWSNSGGRAVGGGSSIAVIPDGEEATGFSGQRLGGTGNTVSRLLRDLSAQTAPSIENTRPCTPPPQSTSTELPPAPVPATPVAVEEEPADTAVPMDVEPPCAPTEDVPSHQPSPPAPISTAPLFDAAFGDYQPSERELRMQRALEDLRSRYPGESVSGAASLLHKIVSNIAQNPSEDKFKSIRKTNRLFASRVASFPECLEFLLALGFEDQGESFVLVRNDAALLWIGRSFLDVVLAA